SCSSCGGCGNEKNVFTDHPISIEIDGTKYYYLYNGEGSVTELINANEEVLNQYRYTPFGSPRLKVESVYNPYRYTGRRLDEETGQYYYRARMYSPQQSRFTTQDPAGMQGSPNMYAYVGNNPTNKRDPSGLGDIIGCIDDCLWAYNVCVEELPESWCYPEYKNCCEGCCNKYLEPGAACPY
ncbi:MAG: RHS repeat domain-containing protein, partial [Thermoplasmata archaeon]